MSPYLCRPEEYLPDRPFADPDKTLCDLAMMYDIVHVLRDVLRSPILESENMAVITRCEGAKPNARTHRFIVNNMSLLKSAMDVTLVGFFGHREASTDGDVLNAADAALLDEFQQHRGLLAYCSYQRCVIQYANLVLFDSPTSQQHWSTSCYHAYIAQEVSPRYYRHIRLHNGRLRGRSGDNVLDMPDICIESTKYFDYAGALACGMPWRGQRHYLQNDRQDHAA